ncbi:hypothetical protein ACVIGB_000070 [Bradyrhizobium sp. USDA 4341]
MAIADFGTVRCFADSDGVDIYFGRGDEVTKAALKSMKGRWVPVHRRWRVEGRYARKSPEQIVAAVAAALEEAAPEFWTKALPKLSCNACVSRAYTLKVGLGGLRIELPPGHVLDWTLEHKVAGAVRDSRSWLIPPSAVTKEVREGVERIMREDHKIFLDAAKFIGPRRIAGVLHIDQAAFDQLGLVAGNEVAADISFFGVADPEMLVAEMHEWCLTVDQITPDEPGSYSAILRYTDPQIAFPFLRARRATETPSPALGAGHVKAKWVRQEKRK